MAASAHFLDGNQMDVFKRIFLYEELPVRASLLGRNSGKAEPAGLNVGV